MESQKFETVDGPEIYDHDLSKWPVATGDLFSPIRTFDNMECAGVVLTPMCDLVQEKIEWVKLVVAHDLQSYLEKFLLPKHFQGLNQYRNLTAKELESLAQIYLCNEKEREVNITLGLVKNLKHVFENTDPRKSSYYYLPSKDGTDRKHGFVVDFSRVFSIPFGQLKQKPPLFRLQSSWREQLLNRYIGYSLRIGTSDYSETCIVETIRALFPELKENDIRNKMKK